MARRFDVRRDRRRSRRARLRRRCLATDRDELGEPALEESRQQYVRRAQTVWRTLRCEPNHPPHKVFAAIEIISLLAGRMR